jgi:hypothetical protein
MRQSLYCKMVFSAAHKALLNKWSDIIIDYTEEEHILQTSVQATLWKLSIEKVKTVIQFIAR